MSPRVTCATGRFPPGRRLRTPAAFKAVFASGRRSSDSQLVVLSRPNGLAHPRLGLAISRSRIGAAVLRNRLKRVVREYFRSHQPEVGGVDLVVLAQSGVEVMDSAKLRASLERHWKRVALCAQS
ncbi:MAG: ribonuclease P protein component [Gammaproteobacteria bacterium]|nr:ribonuclease P protein component [Gammaproteobacteria bacterium]